MEREKGITNDGVHCEMKEDMRAFRQRAGSDASLEEWVKQSVWRGGPASTWRGPWVRPDPCARQQQSV